MKKIILLLMLFVLVGCSHSAPQVDDVDDELEESRRQLLMAEINETKLNCSAEVDLNNTFCFAKKAVYYREMELNEHVKYPFDMVQPLCSASNDSDMCYFYVSMKTKDSEYCRIIQDKIGCSLVSNENFCNTMSNKEECLMNQAFMLQFADISKSAEICKTLSKMYQIEREDDISCRDIDFNPDESNLTYETKFLMTYVLSEIADFEIEKVRVRR